MLPGMKPNNNRAITLIELIISIILMGMVMLGFYGIDIFSHQQLISVDKRSRVQNEAIFTLSHMSKHLLTAIGDNQNPGVTISNSGATIVATIDSSGDGIRDLASDYNISYCFNSSGCNADVPRYTILFNSNMSASPAPTEVISSHVRSFNAILNENLLTLQISTCWQPSGIPQACGTLDNPAVNMNNTIRMPSISVR